MILDYRGRLNVITRVFMRERFSVEGRGMRASQSGARGERPGQLAVASFAGGR